MLRSDNLRRPALWVALGATLGVVLIAGMVLAIQGRVQQVRRLVGVKWAVRGALELGPWVARLRGKPALLLAGDSRLVVDGPVFAGGQWHEVNAAIGGSTAVQWRLWLAEDAPAVRYDAVLFWAGVNDVRNRGASVDETVANALAAIESLGRYAERIVVLEQIPLRFDPDDRARTASSMMRAYNQGLRDALAGRAHVELLALYDSLAAPDGLLAPWCSDDGIHLNAAGNAWLRRRISEQIK